MSNSSKGDIYEALVLEALLAKGYVLIEKNYRSSRGEIDLIMYDQALSPKTLVFIEVKYRASERFGTALEGVTPSKRQKIVHTAKVFLMRHPYDGPCRFDVIGVSSLHQLTHIKSAFESFC